MLRVSIGPYNDSADLERLVAAVRDTLARMIQSAIQHAPRRTRPGSRRGARGDGRDHVRRGDASPDRRLPRRAASEGRDGGRDRGCAEAMRAHVLPVHPRARTSSTSSGPAATARGRSTSRRRPRSSRLRRRRRREAREPRGQLDFRVGGRPRGARLHARAVARAHRRVDRHSRASGSCSRRRTIRRCATLRRSGASSERARSSTCSVR